MTKAMDQYMRAAYEEALAGRSEGGIPIGAVIVRNGEIVGRRHNRRVQLGDPILHGEMDALSNSGRHPASFYKECTLYTTLAPCIMCSGAILLYKIPEVVIGEDVNYPGEPAFLRSRGVKVTILNNEEIIGMMKKYIEENPSVWNEEGEYIDMCTGPHLTYTKTLKAFKLTGLSGAYWKNDNKNKMLTRINCTAFSTGKELEDFLKLQEEAERRDHRKIGKEMKLFMFSDEGPGFPFFLPNGMIVRNALLNYWRELHAENGYQEISTPLILNRCLWETSGHWDHYKDNMYGTKIDDEDYCIKPMNCPGGVMVYANEPHSYRELPMRLAELGLVHRHELRGTLQGLFRVRCFTQDDAHIFMRKNQIADEIAGVVRLIDEVYTKFGFSYSLELSTRPDNSMGSDEDWEAATNGLKDALDQLKLSYTINEGDGAFYGPKIDFHLKDCLGRTWQCGTIQLDFQMPVNFDLSYVDENDEKQRPIMIHRVCFGSIERFIGILTEHFAGRFPVWLVPMQAKILLVTKKSESYAEEIYAMLKDAKIRCELDNRNEKIGYMIRQANYTERVAYMIIIGEKELEEHTLSIRTRDGKTVTMTPDEFMTKIKYDIENRV